MVESVKKIAFNKHKLVDQSKYVSGKKTTPNNLSVTKKNQDQDSSG